MSNKEPIVIEDPFIVQRVKKYLEENIDKTFLDVGIMATSLRQRYPEYKNQNQGKFRKLVEQAFRVVSLSYGLDCQASSNESDGSDVELMDEPASKNLLRNVMNDLYKNKALKSGKDSNAKAASGAEAIDISSDDDDDEKKRDNSKTKSSNDNVKPSETSTPLRPVTIGQINSKVVISTIENGKEGSATQISSNNKRRDIERLEAVPSKKFLSQQQLLQHLSQDAVGSALQNIRNGVVGGGGGNSQLKTSQPVRKYKKIVELTTSHTTFQHMGGIEKQLKELCEILIHLKIPDIYYDLGVVPPRGILLYGPSGTGKTMLATAIAGQMHLALISVPATELIAGVSGESEERIRDVFEQAKNLAPCVLFIDEIDVISTNRLQAQKDMERRVVAQLISSIDSLRQVYSGNDVVLIGATTRPDALDPALRRDGRFDHEVALTIPNRKERKEILRVLCDGILIDPKFDFDKVAELTPGYVAADLSALTARAATISVKKRWSDHLHKLQTERKITIVDLDDIDESIVEGENKKANNNEEANNKEAESNKEQEANNKAGDNSNKTPTEEKEKETNDNTVGSSDQNQKENEKESAADESKADEKMDVDTEKEIETPSEDKTAVVPAKPPAEPTLAEMINWLESPPEDFYSSEFFITLEDFCDAVKILQPSAKREGFITVPDVTWDDIGSLHDIREELRLAILAPVKYPETMERLNLQAPSGVLLCGPPGCGKTLIAKAIANEAGINFISVKGPELMNMYVGESERAVRDCFQRARNSAPCVIFFDEFDSLCPKRSQSNDSGSGTRIVNQLLTEMDGIQERKGVYIMAATNRPDILDPAILRPGRLDTILYVGMPETNDRTEILQAATKNRTNPTLADDVDFLELAKRTDGFTGADLSGLIRQASMMALKESLRNNIETADMSVRMKNFEDALKLLRPSVTGQERKIYDKLREKYAAPRDIAQVNGESVY